MRCLWALLLTVAVVPAQEKTAPPPELDAALRDRVQKFFQAHVEGKFRAADQYVAEESKDAFFAADKPRYLSFEIASITYSEQFTRATATVLCEQNMTMPIGGTIKMKLSRLSLWKLIDGQWFWYIPSSDGVATPFGIMRPGPEAAAPPAPDITKGPTVADVMNMVQADRTEVTLSAQQSSADVALTNRMSGHVTLLIASPPLAGLETRFDRTDLGPNETARLTIRTTAKPAGPRPPLRVEVRVDPAGQIIPIQVAFAAPAKPVPPAKKKK
jgi:hypothetical protein